MSLRKLFPREIEDAGDFAKLCSDHTLLGRNLHKEIDTWMTGLTIKALDGGRNPVFSDPDKE